MSNSLLSVVIPSFNAERFVGAAIRSVLAQTYEPIELVIVDDGSTDGSRRVIRDACAEPQAASVVIIEQENRGAHAAIMRGLEAASGRHLSILNGDDVYDPRRFETLVPHLQRPRGLVFSGVAFIDARGERLPGTGGWPAWYANGLRDAARCPTTGYSLLLHNYSVSSGNFLFTRELYRALGGFGAQRFTHDWDFLLRAVYEVEPVFVPEQLLHYRIHETNASKSVRHRLYAEASESLWRYVAACRAALPPNPLAPCAEHWPRFFSQFCASHHPFFAPERTLASVLAEAGPAAGQRPGGVLAGVEPGRPSGGEA